MPDRTVEAVRHQLRAMGCRQIEIGLRDERTGMMMNRTRNSGEVSCMLPFLKRMNACGNHIYVRPAIDEQHGLIMVDDVEWYFLDLMKADDLNPALVVETSPGNLQVWCRLAAAIPGSLRTCAARILARRYWGDTNSTDGRHYGRFAGFTNRKPAYEVDGRFPFVLLRESPGGTAPAGQALLAEAQEMALAERRIQAQLMPCIDKAVHEAPSDLAGLVQWYEALWDHLLQTFGQQFDESRADWWIAGRLYQQGHGYDSVVTVMRASPGIGRKKGHEEDYIRRTAGKAEIWHELRQQGVSWDDVKDRLLDLAQARCWVRQERAAHQDGANLSRNQVNGTVIQTL